MTADVTINAGPTEFLLAPCVAIEDGTLKCSLFSFLIFTKIGLFKPFILCL